MLYCPLKDAIAASITSKLILTGFAFPYVNGVRMPDVYTSVSTNTGTLVKYQVDSKKDLIPNLITFVTPIPFSFDFYAG